MKCECGGTVFYEKQEVAVTTTYDEDGSVEDWDITDYGPVTSSKCAKCGKMQEV